MQEMGQSMAPSNAITLTARWRGNMTGTLHGEALRISEHPLKERGVKA